MRIGSEGVTPGGTIAGLAREELEAKSGKPGVSQSNYWLPPAAGAVPENDAASEMPTKRKAIARAKKKPKGGKA